MKKITKILCTVCGLLLSGAIVAQTNPYMTRVFDFSPAPGQFIHVYPSVTLGADSASVAAQVETEVAGCETGMLSLGAWGGYIVVGFDHDIQNVAGQNDFMVLGNAFYSSYATYGEPGIVMVADDVNGNGLPDDPWYEIAGNAYSSSLKNYSMTYYKPSAELDAQSGNIEQYVAWKDNQGNTGYLSKNNYHSQSYYPCWYRDSITFTGTIIPEDALSEVSTGYCDVLPNTDPAAGCNIEDAVDANGNPANLQKIRFVKVYTGVYKVQDPFGEISTEFCGAKDLHPTVGTETIKADELVLISNNGQSIQFNAPEEGEARLYNVAGGEMGRFHINNGYNAIEMSHLTDGVYLLMMKSDRQSYCLKVIKR